LNFSDVPSAIRSTKVLSELGLTHMGKMHCIADAKKFMIPQ